jgi:hypothetical protein
LNRVEFQQLSELHLQHAKALLDAKLYSGAYYMCGYVVECALKACICKRTNQDDFYPHPKEAHKAWSHDRKDLIGLADIVEKVEDARRADNTLNIYWREVEGWTVESRYEKHSQREAENLYDAVSHPVHGVLACIKRHW